MADPDYVHPAFALNRLKGSTEGCFLPGQWLLLSGHSLFSAPAFQYSAPVKTHIFSTSSFKHHDWYYPLTYWPFSRGGTSRWPAAPCTSCRLRLAAWSAVRPLSLNRESSDAERRAEWISALLNLFIGLNSDSYSVLIMYLSGSKLPEVCSPSSVLHSAKPRDKWREGVVCSLSATHLMWTLGHCQADKAGGLEEKSRRYTCQVRALTHFKLLTDTVNLKAV